VGPLVVGGFYAPASVLAELPRLGVRDSKLLSPARREEVYARLRPLGRCLSLALAPSVIDRFVYRGRLNELEARAFGRLVRTAGAGKVVADACDPRAERFGAAVRGFAGGRVEVDARHHADRDVPVVGAASIVAKVRRDRAIRRLATRLREEVGSGYPSDPRTTALVRRTLESGGGHVPWIRYSWRTTQRLKAVPTARTLETFG